MRTLKINRVIAIMVSVVMLYVMLGDSAFASSGTPDNLTDKMIRNVNMEIIDINEIENVENSIERVGISICSGKVNEKGEIVYRTITGGVNADITIKEANGNVLTYEVVEGTKKDVLSFDDAGNVTIDGERVYLIEDSEIEQEITMDAVNYYSSAPVSGSYTYNSGKTATHNIALAKKLTKYTVTALVAVINSTVKGLGSVFTSIAGDLISSAVDSDGDVLKLKGTIYYHSVKKAFMVTSSQGCHREALKSYGKTGRLLGNGVIKNTYKYVTVNGA